MKKRERKKGKRKRRSRVVWKDSLGCISYGGVCTRLKVGRGKSAKLALRLYDSTKLVLVPLLRREMEKGRKLAITGKERKVTVVECREGKRRWERQRGGGRGA
jgi:hypothetical protein